MKRIIGTYNTPKETLSAIHQLAAKGYAPAYLSVYTNRKDADYLVQKTDAAVQTVDTTLHTEKEEHASFWEKLKTFFVIQEHSYEMKHPMNKTIVNIDLSPYEKDLQAGKFLLAVEDDGLGHNSNIAAPIPFTAEQDRTKHTQEQVLDIKSENTSK